MIRKFTFAVTSAALAFALAAPLSAHMKMQKSEPAADSTVKAPLKTVQVWFSEAPDAAVSKLTLKGPAGDVKVSGVHVMAKSLMGTVEGNPGPGKYTLAWQSAGDDGHAQKGEFSFTVTQ
jgi:methionine-rich copper-binding protein CopC